MNVLVVAPYWPPSGGGLERYARETAARLAARGHAVRALAFGEEAGERRDRGVEVRLIRPALRLSNTPLSAAWRGAVRAEIARSGADVVLAHGPVPFPLEMAALAVPARCAFVPVIHAGSMEGAGVLNVLAAVNRATFFAHALSRADRIVTVSPFVRDGLLRRHRDKTEVVAPGVDLSLFRRGPPPDPRRVLYVGPVDRAYAWKGFDVLWEAVIRSGVGLEVVGRGDRIAHFEARAAREGIDAEFLGRLDEEGLVRAYHRAGVVVLPSTRPAESFGMVLAEGNACGRPAVGTRMGGIPCFVQEGTTGLLVAPGDPRALARALRDLAADPQRARRMGEAGRRLVEREHDWDRLTLKLEGVLEAASGEEQVAGGQKALPEGGEPGLGR